jgi:predicted short-subunit dehydrogenase-like oxidoreductase (DUF2520 family)
MGVSFDQGPIGIAGAGRVAQALGRLLRERGEPVVAVASRTLDHARAAAAFIGGAEAVPYSALAGRVTRVLIAVSDDALPLVAATLASSGMHDAAALHTCGARGPEALAALEASGVSCAGLHPLQTIASPEQGLAALPGCAFGITGEGPAAAWAERIAALLGGRALRIPADKRPLYHAAAVMASNYVVALIDAAAMLMGAVGIGEDEALAALAPLVGASGANALSLGPMRALTGPVERGDVETISMHLDAMAAAVSPTVRGLYRAAGLHAIEIARRRGLSEANARKLEELLLKSGDYDV